MTHSHRRPQSKIMMSSLFKKVLGGNMVQRSSSPPPVNPPSPDLSHLTPEELQILADVIKRQEQFEHQEQERVKRIQEEMVAAEQEVKSCKSERAGRWRLTTGRLCRLCFKTRMSEGAGRTCSYCRKRVCGRCGTYTPTRSHSGETTGQAWVCRLCQLKRDMVCRTGGWYHGSRGQRRHESLSPLGTTTDVLRKKLEGRHDNTESCMSDFQSSGCDRGDSEMENIPSCHVSDSQIKQRDRAPSSALHQDGARPPRRRGSLPVTSLHGGFSYHRRPADEHDDDEEENIDDIMRERKMSRQRRQEKRMRRRSVKGNSSKDSPTAPPGGQVAAAATPGYADSKEGKPNRDKQDGHKQGSQLRIPKRSSKEASNLGRSREARDAAPKLAALRHLHKSSSDFDDARSSLESSQPHQFYHSSTEAGAPGAASVDAGTRRKAFHQTGFHPGNKVGNSGHPQTSSSLSDSDYTSPACSVSYRSFDSAGHSFLGSEDYGQSFGSSVKPNGRERRPLDIKQRSLGNEEEKLAESSMSGGMHKFRSEEALNERHKDQNLADPKPRLSADFRVSKQNAALTTVTGNPKVAKGQPNPVHKADDLPTMRSLTHSAAVPTDAGESSTSSPRTASTSSSRRVSTQKSPASPAVSPRPQKRRPSASSPTPVRNSGSSAASMPSSSPARRPSPKRSPPKVAVQVTSGQLLADVQARAPPSPSAISLPGEVSLSRRGSRASPEASFCSFCARSADTSPTVGGAAAQQKDLWELVHTLLQKPAKSFPEKFGVQLMGGLQDGCGGLITVLRTVAAGSSAQRAGLQQGDQVMEWNGHPLIDATYERAQSILKATTSDTVHVLTVPRNVSGSRSCSRSSDMEVCSSRSSSPFVVIPSSDSPTHSLNQPSDSPTAGTTMKRRLLPRTPAEIGRESRHMSGELYFSVEYDPPTSILYVNVSMARDLSLPEAGPAEKRRNAHNAAEELATEHLRNSVHAHRAEHNTITCGRADPEGARHHMPSPFVLLRLLPENGSRETMKTEIYGNTCHPKWEQTFVYDCFTITELVARCLELTLWSREERGDVFLGEVLLDLRDLPRYANATWCSLHDHDDNSPPLPRPRCLTAINSPASSRSSSFYDASDVARSLEAQDPSRDSSQGGTNSGRGSSPTTTCHSAFHLTNAQTDATKGAKTTRRRVKSRMSRVSNSLSLSDRKEAGSDESSTGDVTRQQSATDGNMADTSPGVQRRTSYTMDLLAPPRPLSRANSSSSFFLSDDSSDEDLYSPTPVTPDRPAPEGDDITSILGPGQVPPRPSNETLVCGDIKVGFNVSKGQLEVDIICVKGLQRPGNTPLPDTYVKTYLVEGQKTIQKKKTHVVKATTDPVFRRKIKYSACNVHGRHMRIVVWERPRNFERKQSLGEAVVRLDALDLSTHTMTWYKLFPLNSTDLGSTDSLSQW